MATLLPEDACIPTDPKNTADFGRFLSFLDKSMTNVYDEFINSENSFLKSGKREFKKLMTKDQKNVFEFVFEPVADCFVRKVFFGYIMGRGGIGFKNGTDDFDTQHREDWIFRDISSLEVFLNDKILVDCDGQGMYDLQNTKYMSGKIDFDINGVTIDKKPIITYREDVLLPVKCNIMEEKPIFMVAGSKLRFKFICDYNPQNFIKLSNSSDTLTNELESLNSILTILYDEPMVQLDKELLYNDKNYFFHTQKYEEIPVAQIGIEKNMLFPSLRYGNMITTLFSFTGDNATRNNGSRINFPHGVDIKLSTRGGLHTVSHGNDSINSADHSKNIHKTPFTTNFSEFDKNTKTRLYNKTTTTKTLGQIGFNINTNQFLKEKYEIDFETLAVIVPRSSYLIENYIEQTHG